MSEAELGSDLFAVYRREYSGQVRWLLLSRVLVILICLAILLVYEEGSPRIFSTAYVVLVGALTLAAAQLALFRRVQEMERFVLYGVLLDVAGESALAYLTGGIYNVGFAFLFFATILSAALLLSDRAAFLVASVATVALSAVAAVYYAASHGFFQPIGVPPELYQQVQLRWGRITANLIGVGAAFHGVAFLGTRLPYRVSQVRILYDEVFERMREGLVAIDRRGRVVLVNREACRLLNWGDPGSLLDRPFEQVLRRREDRTVLEVLARGEDMHTELALLLRGREEPMPVEVVTTVLRDDRGAARGVVGIFRDLSLKRRMEEMETRLARLSGVEEMALHIVHEIRTPLASIRGCVQELTSRSQDDDADRRLAGIVRRESDRLDRILQEYLDYARMRPSVPQPLDLRELTEETLLLLSRRPDAEGVALTCLPGAPVLVRGDADQLRQVLLNLGKNALDALQGRGRLQISFRQVDLPERSSGPERRLGSRRGVELVLEDDSPKPVPPEDRGRVFLPFFTTKKGGLGLGLAICQKILRLHDGDITCEASSLGGTGFRLRLPLLEEGPAPADGTPAEGAAAAPGVA